MNRPALTALLLVLAVGCGDDPTATLLYVNVMARDGVPSAPALAVTLSQGSASEETRFLQAENSPTMEFPSSFVIRADGRSGTARVNLQARTHASLTVGDILAQGQATATLEAGRRVDMTVWLEPQDVQVKDKITPAGVYGNRPGVAGDGQGNHVIVWEDSSGGSSFDILFRLFDKKGTRLYTDALKQSREHQPAVAMQQAGSALGSFVVAWVRGSGGKGAIFSQNMNKSGKSAGLSQPVSLSALASHPRIAARLPSGYFVVWQEEDASGGTHRIMGRVLNSQGLPATGPTGQPQPFLISSFTRGSADPLPAVAADAQGGAMVVWNAGGTVKGTVYATVGGSLKLVSGNYQLAKTDTGQAAAPDVAALPYGYAVIWSDKSSFAPDTSGQCIKLRRFSSGGVGLAAEYTLNTTTSQDQLNPSLAARGRDGSLLATWTSKDATGIDPDGSVRARALLHNGLPVGDDFLVNTATSGPQQSSAVATHAGDGFTLVFTDGAGGSPALRSRFIFPDYVGADGQVGALCEGQNQCSPSLYCVSTQAGRRCLAPCKGGATAACLNGGVCFTNTKLSASYCQYPVN